VDRFNFSLTDDSGNVSKFILNSVYIGKKTNGSDIYFVIKSSSVYGKTCDIYVKLNDTKNKVSSNNFNSLITASTSKNANIASVDFGTIFADITKITKDGTFDSITENACNVLTSASLNKDLNLPADVAIQDIAATFPNFTNAKNKLSIASEAIAMEMVCDEQPDGGESGTTIDIKTNPTVMFIVVLTMSIVVASSSYIAAPPIHNAIVKALGNPKLNETSLNAYFALILFLSMLPLLFLLKSGQTFIIAIIIGLALAYLIGTFSVHIDKSLDKNKDANSGWMWQLLTYRPIFSVVIVVIYLTALSLSISYLSIEDIPDNKKLLESLSISTGVLLLFYIILSLVHFLPITKPSPISNP
jgi:hypothetical protein